MGPAFAWLLALRYLASRWINVLGVIGVAFAVWALIVVRGVFTGLIADIRDDCRRSAPELLVTSLPHETGYEELLPALRDDDVVATAPRLRHFGIFYKRVGIVVRQSIEIEFKNRETSFAQLIGIDPDLERKVTQFDEWLAATDTDLPQGKELNAPLALEYAARQLAQLPVPDRPTDLHARWPGLLLGLERSANLVRPSLRRDEVMLLHPQLGTAELSALRRGLGFPIDVVGVDFAGVGKGEGGDVQPLQSTFAFAGTFKTGAKLFDETVAFVPIESLRTMLGHDALDSGSIDLVTDVAVRTRPGLDDAQLKALADRLRTAVRRQLGARAAPADVEVLTWEQQNAVFLDAVETERAMMTVVVGAVMLIAAFLIYATLRMMVTQKIRDIGILAALGGSPRGIGQLFTRCGFVIGGVGVPLGLLGGTLSLHWLNPFNDWLYATFGVAIFDPRLYDIPQIPWRNEPHWLIGVGLSSLLLVLVVAWLPARNAARMHPVLALSHD